MLQELTPEERKEKLRELFKELLTKPREEREKNPETNRKRRDSFLRAKTEIIELVTKSHIALPTFLFFIWP